jgi:hypothetical protein
LPKLALTVLDVLSIIYYINQIIIYFKLPLEYNLF